MSAVAVVNISAAATNQEPIAVPPPAASWRSARLAFERVFGSATAIAPHFGNSHVASWLPATTPNDTPSWMQSIAAAVAIIAAVNFERGIPMEPDTSTTMITLRVGAFAGTASAAVAVTHTSASTWLAPTARNWF